jgi:drug/metabolite transporter (DMT)-like permease
MTPRARSGTVPVVFWMTLVMLAFSVMAVSIRALAGTLSIFEILCVRTVSGLAVLLAIIAARPDVRPGLVPRRMTLHAVRSVVHFSAQYGWALSLTLLPLASVFAIEFTTPAWASLLAVAVLGERMTTSRLGALVLGCLGVLVIVRPGAATFQPAALLVLAAAVGFAVILVQTKMLTAGTTTLAILFWMNLMQLPIAVAGSNLAFPARLGTGDLPALLGVGVSGIASHYCLTNAFRAGEATLVVPLDFARLPLIALVGWQLYGEPLDPWVFAGAALIVSGIVWNLRAETSVRRAAAPSPTPRR